MKKVNLGKCVLCVIGATLFIGCSCRKQNYQSQTFAKEFIEQARTVVTNELYQEKTIEASKAMQQLMEENRLPGFVPGEHGTITSDNYLAMESNDVVRVVYPISQTFHLVKYGEIFTNSYTFERVSKDSLWQLKKAWKTDPNGQVVNEWRIK